MNESEIIKYHIMKNRVYIIAEDINKTVKIYNVIKLKQIAEFENVTLSKVIELLDKFDTVIQKTWFSVEIKTGCIAVIFQKNNVFNNQYNFDDEFIEKVLEKTNYLTNIPPNLAKEMSFQTIDMSKTFMNSMSSTNNTNFSQTPNNFSRTSMNNMNNKKGLSLVEKMDTLGGIYLVSLFDNFVKKIYKLQMKYFDNNFIDPKNKITSLVIGSSSSNMSMYPITKKDKDQKEDDIDSTIIKHFGFFIYSHVETNITVGPSIDELNSNFELPEFLKDIIKVVRTMLLMS